MREFSTIKPKYREICLDKKFLYFIQSQNGASKGWCFIFCEISMFRPFLLAEHVLRNVVLLNNVGMKCLKLKPTLMLILQQLLIFH